MRSLGYLVCSQVCQGGNKLHVCLGVRNIHSIIEGMPESRAFNLISCVKYCTVQFSRSVEPTLCGPMDCSTQGLPVNRQLPEFTQTHVHWVRDAIQLSHPLSSPFPPAFNLSYHQGLFKWISSLHQVAKWLEFQLQHQSFQWIFRTDFL